MLFRVVEERNIKYYRLSLLPLLSLDAQSYTNFLELKSTIRMRKMSFTKLKAILHSLWKVLDMDTQYIIPIDKGSCILLF